MKTAEETIILHEVEMPIDVAIRILKCLKKHEPDIYSVLRKELLPELEKLKK